MKITNNYKNALVRFDSLEAGDVFSRDNENNVYMKTEPITDEYGGDYNAVILTDGELYGFTKGELVRKVQCELIIE